MRVFVYELRLLLRDRAAWLLTALFAGVLYYGLNNGVELAERQREATSTILTATQTFDGQVREALTRQAIDPRQLARQPLAAVLPPASPIAASIGESFMISAINGSCASVGCKSRTRRWP